MVCFVCDLVFNLVGSVMRMGRWSEERSVDVFHVSFDDKLGEQNVMSGEEKLKFAWCGMCVCISVLFSMYNWSSCVDNAVPLCVMVWWAYQSVCFALKSLARIMYGTVFNA